MYVPRNSLLNLKREPKDDSSRKRRRTSSYRSKYGMAGAGILLVALLLIAALLQKNDPQNQTLSAGAMSQDLGQLWLWNERLLEGGAEHADWTIRWDAALAPSSDIASLADEVFVKGKGEASDKVVTNEGKSISGPYSAIPGARLTIHESERTGRGVSVIILLETASGKITREQLQEGAESVAAAVARFSSDGKATLKSRGYSRMNDGSRELTRIAMGRVLEQYEDGGTRSVTMHTDKLVASQSLDGYRTANLQAAEHRNTENGKAELAIGIPLLSGEFGVAVKQP